MIHALGLPLAAAGMIVWYLPFAAAGVVARLANPEHETIATIKLLAGIIAFPAMYLGWIALAAGLGGATGAVLVARDIAEAASGVPEHAHLPPPQPARPEGTP